MPGRNPTKKLHGPTHEPSFKDPKSFRLGYRSLYDAETGKPLRLTRQQLEALGFREHEIKTLLRDPFRGTDLPGAEEKDVAKRQHKILRSRRLGTPTLDELETK